MFVDTVNHCQFDSGGCLNRIVMILARIRTGDEQDSPSIGHTSFLFWEKMLPEIPQSAHRWRYPYSFSGQMRSDDVCNNHFLRGAVSWWMSHFSAWNVYMIVRHRHTPSQSEFELMMNQYKSLTVSSLVGRLSVVCSALLSRTVWKIVDCFWRFWKRVLNSNKLPLPCQTTIQVFGNLDSEDDGRPGSSVFSIYILWFVVSSWGASWMLQQVLQNYIIKGKYLML